MENPNKYPDWPAPYTAFWSHERWLVWFPNQQEADKGLRLLRMEMNAPKLAAFSFGGDWFVGLDER